MRKVLAVANQKGGVGKTTTAINLAVGLQMAQQRVLLVDLDPQANATSGLGLAARHGGEHFLGMPPGQVPLADHWQEARNGGLMLLPAGPVLARPDRLLANQPQPHHTLQGHLATVAQRFDYAIVDCPPSLGLLTVNALTAADSVLIPIQSEYFAMEGLSQILGLIQQIRRTENPKLTIEGILLTLHDPSLELAEEVEQELGAHVGERLYGVRIVRDVALAESPSYGQAIIDYAPRSPGSWAYQRFVREFLARERSTDSPPKQQNPV
jgi:chromosome partitioning protein